MADHLFGGSVCCCPSPAVCRLLPIVPHLLEKRFSFSNGQGEGGRVEAQRCFLCREASVAPRRTYLKNIISALSSHQLPPKPRLEEVNQLQYNMYNVMSTPTLTWKLIFFCLSCVCANHT